jgi:putative PIN family toxin of toxin-antitoxin system
LIAAALDTNVLASGAIAARQPESVPGRIIATWRVGGFELIVSEHILTELARTLEKPYFASRLPFAQQARTIDLLRTYATITPITAPVHGVATHPEDDLTLATAVSAEADYLVTGDRKLQQLGTYRRVGIITPRAFLRILEATDAQ